MRALPPPAGLADFVSRYVHRDFDLMGGSLARPVTASVSATLILFLGDPSDAADRRTGMRRRLPVAIIGGPQSEPVGELIALGHHASFTVEFHPAALTRLFPVPARDLVNRVTDAVSVCGPDVLQLAQRVRSLDDPAAMAGEVTRYLLERAAGARPLTQAHRAALELHRTNGATALSTLVAHSGLSQRHFERQFVQEIGMPPKRFARICRLSFAVQLRLKHRQSTWTRVSYEAGYADQNHLIRDFKHLTGSGPTEFWRSIHCLPVLFHPTELVSGAPPPSLVSNS